MDRGLFMSVVRTDFPAFVQKAFEILNPGRRYDPNWHIDAMVYALQLMEQGAHRRQIITMPPRSLKSIVVSVAWPAFLLGRDPAVQIVVVSYTEALAVKLSNDTRRLMESDFYKEVFPDTHLVTSNNPKLATDQGGLRFATSINGPVTGFGGDWIIIDDPHSAADAFSAANRDTAKRYYDEILSTRLNDATGKFVLVMQRIHQDDLAGHLLSRGGWAQLKLQARATEDAEISIGPGLTHSVRVGDLLHPARLPQEILDERLREMGSVAFQAQYQQDPVPPGGLMIKKEWLSYYDVEPDRAGGRVILSLDTATKTDPSHDYSVCTAWLAKDNRHYLIGVWRDRVDFPTLKRKVIELRDIHRADTLLIEDKASGSSLIQELKNAGVPAIGRKANDSKEARLAAASTYLASGLMLLPRDAPWRAAFETELLGFPGAQHDDQVDSLSQYFGWVRDTPPPMFKVDWMRDDLLDHGLIGEALAMRGWRG